MKTTLLKGAIFALAVVASGAASLAQPSNDECANALTIDPGQTLTGSNVGATGSDITSCTTNDVFDVWYRLTAVAAAPHTIDTLGPIGFDTSLAVYSDCGGSELACDDDAAGNLRSRVTVNLAAGQVVLVRVCGYNANTGTFTLNVRTPPPPPSNDACTAAASITTLPFRYLQDVSGATEDLDSSCNAAAAVASFSGVWFTYSPAQTQRIRFQEASASNVVIAVYTGECDALGELTCSDPEDFVYEMAGGQTYRILLATQAAASLPVGSILDFNVSAVSPSTNDACADARVIASTPFADTVDAASATGDIDVGCNSTANSETRHGVWYRFTPTEPGRITLNDTSANDVILSIFTGDCSGGLAEVYCTDAEPGPAFEVAVGTTYYILIGMWSSTTVPTAPFSFTLTFAAAPGACCAPSGCVIVAGSAACAGINGSWRGSGSSCGDPQARNDSVIQIPDYPAGGPVTTVESSVVVNETNVITDLNVLVNISHEYAGDLYVRLTGPNGTTVDLFKRAGSASCTPGELAGANGFNDFLGIYIIDDQASASWHSALVTGPSPVPAGAYRPASCGDVATSLNTAFAGISAQGTWTLKVSDEDEGVVGTVASFGIIVNGGVGQPCTSANGACCLNASCSVSDQAGCVGPGRRFAGASTVCNIPGNVSSPCCRADTNQDGSVTIQDLFDFLANWFAQAPGANADGIDGIGLQDLFDFLRGWFAQCA